MGSVSGESQEGRISMGNEETYIDDIIHSLSGLVCTYVKLSNCFCNFSNLLHVNYISMKL